MLTRYVYSIQDTRSQSQPIRPAQAGSFAWLPATPQPPAAPSLVGLLLPTHCSCEAVRPDTAAAACSAAIFTAWIVAGMLWPAEGQPCLIIPPLAKCKALLHAQAPGQPFAAAYWWSFMLSWLEGHAKQWWTVPHAWLPPYMRELLLSALQGADPPVARCGAAPQAGCCCICPRAGARLLIPLAPHDVCARCSACQPCSTCVHVTPIRDGFLNFICMLGTSCVSPHFSLSDPIVSVRKMAKALRCAISDRV